MSRLCHWQWSLSVKCVDICVRADVFYVFMAQWLISLFLVRVRWANLCARVKTKKQSPQDKHEYPYTHTWGPSSHSHKMALFFCRFLQICWKSGHLERGRDHFCSHPQLTSTWNNVREFREAASMDPNLGKNGRDRTVFFFRLALKINAGGGWKTEKLIIVP